jgi:hypothetical protein
MELDPDVWFLAVTHAHHDRALVVGVGGLDHLVGERRALDAQRVVPTDL